MEFLCKHKHCPAKMISFLNCHFKYLQDLGECNCQCEKPKLLQNESKWKYGKQCRVSLWCMFNRLKVKMQLWHSLILCNVRFCGDLIEQCYGKYYRQELIDSWTKVSMILLKHALCLRNVILLNEPKCQQILININSALSWNRKNITVNYYCTD